ncbi:hypothetical protein GCM10022234_26870 [Aeromicrobium panaciterrae]|uniref:LPXTG cell wall anchor domain-containing protein n=1 Tax=Aeromicrobium panaciterrae TaxID=363861 RepID=UPI0031D05CB0
MKKILLVLAMLAVSVFIAQPAISAEGDGADTPTTTETTTAPETPAAEEPAVEQPAAEEPAAEQPAAEEPAAEQPAADAPAARTKSVPEGDDAKKAKDKDDEADDEGGVVAAAAVNLNDKVDICHVPPGNPANAQSISVSYNSIVKGQGHAQDNAAHAGDWIPSFDYMVGDDVVTYPGRNTSQANPCAQIVALIEVDTEDPLLIAPTCSADGLVDVPTTEGVVYTVTPANAPGEVDVDATAAPGYVLAEDAVIHWDFTVLEQLSGQIDCPVITDDPPDSTDVKICHATASFQNPYNVIPPATAGVANGHDEEHNGPIFNGVDAGWGDIIEPYVYNGVEYPGQNWTAEGQAIYANGCEPVDEVEPTPPTVTDPTCELDGTLSVPADTDAIDYSQEPEGTGPGDYVVTATATPGNFISGQSEFPVTVEPKLSADDPACVTGGTEPGGEEDGLLPDTGGSSLLLLVLAGSMMAAGFMVLAGRKPVGAALGQGVVYSPILPPTHTAAQSWVSKLVAAIKATFRGNSH